MLVGGLALLSGVAGEKTETKSAISTLLSQPFGRIWVGASASASRLRLLASGASHCRYGRSWHQCQRPGHSNGASGKCCDIFWSCRLRARPQLPCGGGDEGSGEKDLAQWIMSQPFGSYLLIAVGAGFVIGGGVTAAKGLTRKFERYLRIPDRMRSLPGFASTGS